MKLIKFNSLEKINYTKYKEMEVDNNINGKVFHETIKTGIPDSIRTVYKRYIIPENQIYALTDFDGKYTVNDITVDKENYFKIIEQMENNDV